MTNTARTTAAADVGKAASAPAAFLTDIPADVMDDAKHVAGLIAFYATDPAKRDEAVTNFVAEAIMAERERCARIAAEFPNMGEASGRQIAANIRVGAR